jgi:hypothetical protein
MLRFRNQYMGKKNSEGDADSFIPVHERVVIPANL